MDGGVDMGNLFRGWELVKIGIQIEKNGRDFYNALAGRLKDSQAAGIFRYLAGEEEKHMAVFQGILDKIDKDEPAESYPGEYVDYMKVLAGESIFTEENKGRELAQKPGTDKEAVNMGIDFEKDSIVFYQGMKKAVPKSDHKIIDDLIGQEQNHLRQLVDLKKKL